MSLLGLSQALRRHAWWLLVGALLGAVVGLTSSLLRTPLYTTHTQLFVSTTGASSTADVFQGSQFSQGRVTSYAELIQGSELSQQVIDDLGLDMSADDLTQAITATVAPDTVLLNVTVTDPSPERAQAIADDLGRRFIELVGDLETSDIGGGSPVKVSVVQRPELPDSPSSPNILGNAALGVVSGALVALAALLVVSRLDRSVRGTDEAAALTGAPLIGAVAHDAALHAHHVINRGAGRAAEDYRHLRNNLQFLNPDDPPKVIMVSSALPSEGKTTLVVNLAAALAEAGKKVTVVEADLRKPRVTQYLGLIAGVGLTNILVGAVAADEVTQDFEDRFSVIAAGPTPPNPGELLTSSHMTALIQELRATNDFVLLDAPPLLPVADSSALAAHTDGVVLSVRYGKTRREQLEQAAANVHRVGTAVLGVVLNIVPAKAELASAYGYGYEYGPRPQGADEASVRRTDGAAHKA